MTSISRLLSTAGGLYRYCSIPLQPGRQTDTNGFLLALDSIVTTRRIDCPAQFCAVKVKIQRFRNGFQEIVKMITARSNPLLLLCVCRRCAEVSIQGVEIASPCPYYTLFRITLALPFHEAVSIERYVDHVQRLDVIRSKRSRSRSHKRTENSFFHCSLSLSAFKPFLSLDCEDRPD